MAFWASSVHPLVERYASMPGWPALSYATVRDYCDSADHFPRLATLQADLKDVERPWAVKAILNNLKPGARLLEVGSGEPHASAALADFGYDVTICDPFDGSGRGPTEFERFKAQFPRVKFIRALFTPEIAKGCLEAFDCVFSISVLEHVRDRHLTDVFEATQMALRPGGYSIHVVDHVLQGNGDAWHANQVQRVVGYQRQLAGLEASAATVGREVQTLFARAAADLETFYLSPQGHNLWRGPLKYEDFQFRKCIAVQTIVQKAANKTAKIAG
jgi:SAM-dependent methyltransferase